MIRKPTEANGHSLVFSLQNNSPMQKRHADHQFCVQIFDFQYFRRSGGVKRPEWETFLGHSDVPCGPDIVLSSISLCSWNNWLFILEYPIVLAAIKLVNRSLKRFDISHLGGVKRNVLVHSRIYFFFYYFFRLNRTLLHPCWFINRYDVV